MGCLKVEVRTAIAGVRAHTGQNSRQLHPLVTAGYPAWRRKYWPGHRGIAAGGLAGVKTAPGRPLANHRPASPGGHVAAYSRLATAARRRVCKAIGGF